MFASAREEQSPVIEVDISHAREQADAIARIVEGSIAGVIVRGVLTPGNAAELVRRLERDGGSLPTFRPPVFKGYVLGRPLVSASDGLSGYLDEADRFRAGCTVIFQEFPRLQQCIHDALAALAGGRVVSVPRGADGRPYLAATIRVLIEGDRLPLHYENETLRSPVMAALRPLLDPSTLMSFYVPLATPRAGGLLRLFRTHCLDGGDSLVDRLGGEERARPHFERQGFALVLPRIGDLLVFDGGRWYHDVTPVEGGTRWTLGGFLAVTRDRRAVHYWS
jgi:hapalindole-type alkaloid chlorinase